MMVVQASDSVDTLTDQRRDRLLEKETLTKIASHRSTHPDHELRGNRLVEAELAANLGNLLGGSTVTRDRGGRIARGQPQHEENHDSDDR